MTPAANGAKDISLPEYFSPLEWNATEKDILRFTDKENFNSYSQEMYVKIPGLKRAKYVNVEKLVIKNFNWSLYNANVIYHNADGYRYITLESVEKFLICDALEIRTNSLECKNTRDVLSKFDVISNNLVNLIKSKGELKYDDYGGKSHQWHTNGLVITFAVIIDDSGVAYFKTHVAME